MKKLLFIVASLFIVGSICAQKVEMKYSSKTKDKIKSIILKDAKVMSQLKKMSKRQQNEFLDKMATFYALKSNDQNGTAKVCLECLASKKLINASEKKILNQLLFAKSIKVKYLKELKSKQEYSTEYAGVIIGGIADVYLEAVNGQSEVTSYGSFGRAVGALVGGTIVLIGTGASGGTLSAPAVGVGVAVGVAVGDAVDDAINEYLKEDGSGGDSVVAREDGRDCQGFPINL